MGLQNRISKKLKEHYTECLIKPGKRGRKLDPKNTIIKVAEILTQKNMQSFFDVDYDGQTLTFPMKQH
ncbi:hypothetical protein B9L23_06910 [Parageobacillus galactosidasius]|uniref:Uncharacterized protein n=1 Tax=Parageobacillus galactosidasius TaxID=883812 RepID=A0A226QSN8_9BACL|nr:hypothetical protein B9L23_06910 [Parageobacillus galactosidasius]